MPFFAKILYFIVRDANELEGILFEFTARQHTLWKNRAIT